MTREIKIRAKAFSGEGVRTHRAIVDGSMVRVWDSVAGCYTACHSLSPRTVRRIVRMTIDDAREEVCVVINDARAQG